MWGHKVLKVITITDNSKTFLKANTMIVSRARLLPFLRSDGRKEVWSIELTQLRNLAAGVGMKIRSHVNCEYCFYSLEDGE